MFAFFPPYCSYLQMEEAAAKKKEAQRKKQEEEIAEVNIVWQTCSSGNEKHACILLKFLYLDLYFLHPPFPRLSALQMNSSDFRNNTKKNKDGNKKKRRLLVKRRKRRLGKPR